MNKQRAYDEYIAWQKRELLILNSAEWAMLFPIADMVKKGWLAPCKTVREKVFQLFSFLELVLLGLGKIITLISN